MRVYMDHGATTAVDPEVKKEMMKFFSDEYGNASQMYEYGRNAAIAVQEARERVAKLIGAEQEREIIFNSGGTEADNLALKGIMLAKKNKKKHMITSVIEHPAVLRTAEYLETQGIKVTYLPVNNFGLISLEDLKKKISSETALVSIMHANNEIGTIEPIREIGEIAHDAGALFHTDAVQTVGKIPVDVKNLNIDLLSMSAHKLYGPKGVGALYKKQGIRLEPVLHGGGHENGYRSGTENVSGIVGLGKAAEIAQKVLLKEKERLTKMRDRIIDNFLKLDDTILNGHRTIRLPHNANLSFKYVEGEALILRLDAVGIYGSTGSACSTKKLEASHVLLAIGLRHEVAHGSLRLTLGRWNTDKEVDYVIKEIPQVIKELREMSAFRKETEEYVMGLKDEHDDDHCET
ncbi:MAG: cysteine desulfurase NifS [Candidatus Heimdallarchaeota archaeon]|nr:cysteine desulfurase NifS [Candidatus Heimdallarchaeota archaeon]MBY8993011.1 cysteine desulfurase NifS [Candidatus Heimdallarchaeota archaeon]